MRWIASSEENAANEAAGKRLLAAARLTRVVAEMKRRVSGVEELEAVVSANLQPVPRLRESILQNAFSGELAHE